MLKRTKKEWKAVQVRYIHLHCHFSDSKQKYFIKFTQNIPLIYLREKIFAGKGEIKADTVHRHCKILNVNTSCSYISPIIAHAK
ncbi:MAG: hypothetical protein E4G94_09110 [ANME-2 cluster archaeon]|nr:MAG: hypothetical protein E4G94_09110 [ANME-2 cluster archaeon]